MVVGLGMLIGPTVEECHSATATVASMLLTLIFFFNIV